MVAPDPPRASHPLIRNLSSISCPANITVAATSPSGAVVNYVAPVGTETVRARLPRAQLGLASGSTFPIGTTTVTYKVTDRRT